MDKRLVYQKMKMAGKADAEFDAWKARSLIILKTGLSKLTKEKNRFDQVFRDPSQPTATNKDIMSLKKILKPLSDLAEEIQQRGDMMSTDKGDKAAVSLFEEASIEALNNIRTNPGKAYMWAFSNGSKDLLKVLPRMITYLNQFEPGSYTDGGKIKKLEDAINVIGIYADDYDDDGEYDHILEIRSALVSAEKALEAIGTSNNSVVEQLLMVVRNAQTIKGEDNTVSAARQIEKLGEKVVNILRGVSQ